MNNIRQITNYDLNDAPLITKVITKAGAVVSCSYKIIDLTRLKGTPFKLGYCCEPKGIAYPIFLTFPDGEKEIQLGKTGMYEFQPEDWVNINGDNIERTAIVYCSQVTVPADIKFTLDYCYSID